MIHMSGPINRTSPPLNLQRGSGGVSFVFPYAYAAGTNAFTANRLYAIPLLITRTTTFDQIGIDIPVTPASGGGGTYAKALLGIYQNDDAYAGASSVVGSGPGALIVDAGEVTTLSTTGLKAITIAQTLSPGWYWLAVAAAWNYTTAPIPRNGIVDGSYAPLGWNAGALTNLTSQIYSHWLLTFTYGETAGALPNPFTAGATLTAGNNAIPQVFLRVQ